MKKSFTSGFDADLIIYLRACDRSRAIETRNTVNQQVVGFGYEFLILANFTPADNQN